MFAKNDAVVGDASSGTCRCWCYNLDTAITVIKVCRSVNVVSGEWKGNKTGNNNNYNFSLLGANVDVVLTLQYLLNRVN